MEKRDIVMTLQQNLMKLAQAFIEKKGINKPWGGEKEEFSIYHEQFKALIDKLPIDFYFDETTDNKYVDKILELTIRIKNKIESLKKSNSNH